LKDKNLKTAIPPPKTIEISTRELQEVHRDNQMERPAMRPDPSSEHDGNLSHYKYENSYINTTKTSPNNNLSQSLDAPHRLLYTAVRFDINSKQE